MRKGWKKAVSTMLCAAMILSMSSFMVSADGETTDPQTPPTVDNGETENNDGPTNEDPTNEDPTNDDPTNEDPTNEDPTNDDTNNDQTNDGADNNNGNPPADGDGQQQPSNSLPMTSLTPATPAAENGIMPMAEPTGETVCTVGENPYSSVNEAIENANGKTVILTADVTEDVVIPENTTVTIELGNYTITNSSDHTITVKSGANLTITGNGTVDNVTHAKAAIWNEGTVTLNGGTYTRSLETGSSPESGGTNTYYNIVNHGEMTINDGVEVSQSGQYSSMVENGWQNGLTPGADTSTMTINGVTFSGGLNTIKNDDYGKLTINNGFFTNVAQAALLNWNEAEIKGGNFESNTPYAVILNGYINDSMDKGILTISGGSFTSNGGGDAIQDMGGSSKGGKITITGGTFNSDLNFGGKGSAVVDISNATIDGDVTAEAAATVEIKDSTVTGDITGDNVTIDNSTSNNYVATVGGKGYESLEKALAATATAVDKTVTLTKDVELTEQLNITTAGVTLNLNNHTISAADGFTGSANHEKNLVQILADRVTIQNGTIKAGGSHRNVLNAQGVTGVVLEGLTLDHSDAGEGAPLIVNGSSVTMTGNNNLKLGSGSWGGINVDPSKGTEKKATLEFADNSTLNILSNPNNMAIIWIDNEDQGIATITNAAEVGLVKDANGNYVKASTPSVPDTDDTTPSRPSGSSSSSSSSSSSNVSYSPDPEQSKREAEENMWKRAINKINSARDGSSLKIYTGIVDEIPDYVLDALRENNVTVTFYNQDGDEVTIPAGMAPKSLRDSWTYKQLGNYVLSLDEVVTEVEETTETTETTQPAAEQTAPTTEMAKPNPETGDASSSMMAIAAAAASLCGVVLLSKKNK